MRGTGDEILLVAGQMREIEATAIKSGAVSGLELMELAGRHVVDRLNTHWPALAEAPGRAMVLCGPGNNGGDGYVVARLLQGLGWSVQTFQFDRFPPEGDATRMRAEWAKLGEVGSFDEAERFVPFLGGGDLVVDAVFGSGLTRPLEGGDAVFLALQACLSRPFPDRPKVVAVDIPSGLCADSGRVLGEGSAGEGDDLIHADLTVTFQTMFTGHVLGDAPAMCGVIDVVPLGRAVEAALRDRTEEAILAQRVAVPDAGLLGKRADGHKFQHGAALVLAGEGARSAAARMTAEAALRIGAGIVTLGVPRKGIGIAAAHVTEVMLAEVDGALDLQVPLSDNRVKALALGPGLGCTARGRGLLLAALVEDRPTVLDADALTMLAENEELAGLVHGRCVLTPHWGEFARLCPDVVARMAEAPRKGPAYSRIDAARAAARRYGAVIVLKGPDTVIAQPDGQVWVHGGADRAAPWLATAGAGDVLAGMIAGLMARGWSPAHAACDAVWLHAEAARQFGPGLVAGDITRTLPKVFAALGVT